MGAWYLKCIHNTVKVRVSYRNQRRNAVEGNKSVLLFPLQIVTLQDVFYDTKMNLDCRVSSAKAGSAIISHYIHRITGCNLCSHTFPHLTVS